MNRRPPGSPLFPYTTLFRSLRYLLTLVTDDWPSMLARLRHYRDLRARSPELTRAIAGWHVEGPFLSPRRGLDRKSTRLNSSHLVISYAVFCLKKQNTNALTR